MKKSERKRGLNKFGNLLKYRGSQVTVFVIIAIILVVGIAGYFIAKNYIYSNIPSSVQPVYNYYLSCLQNTVKDGASIMASQGGYLELPDFEAGTEYAPFSSQLGFVGLGIPYWYYISGNGIAKEQVPTKSNMEKQLANYLLENAGNCDFSDFEKQGFTVNIEDASSAKSSISESSIKSSLSQLITIDYGETHTVINSHSFQTDSNLGKFYELARKIFDYEKKSMFLENYTLDVLYSYAPVDSVSLDCAPVMWNPYDVADNLKNAISANLGMVKLNGQYYVSKNKYDDYFVAGKDSGIELTNEQIRFQYSADMPSRIEIWPTKGNMMIAEPIGTQPGLNVMGFCYAPYKFVYDIYFPVLIQIYDGNSIGEIFQFPFSVVISKNNPREAMTSEYFETTESICDNANSEIFISTLNNNLLPVEANIEFKCLDDTCSLGQTKINNITKSSSILANVPQCVNGIITATAEGYKQSKYIISTNQETSAQIFLDKEYTLPLEIYVDGSLTKELSVLVINQKADDGSESMINSVSYPYSKEIKSSDGYYSFDLKVYKNSDITIPSTTTTQCVNSLKSGIMGVLGFEEEKCTDLTIPAQKLSNYVYAGGKANYYISQSELDGAKTFRVFARSVPAPQTLENAQDNYEIVQTKLLDIQII
ncbi:MAG: hypothetical protein Q8L27_02820 [archaeon]|nr:hypothetical protein [archaeon]